nr:uncharacterized mitochondrial protein AtMg00810-like [Tanacetum cinerariifolium]
ISSSKNSSGNEDGNIACVSTASTTFPIGSVNVATISQNTASAYIASQSNGSQIKFENINQIDEDDIEEMDIKWSMALLSIRADKFWKRTGKKISTQGSDVAGFDKSKVECFNCHKMGHFARECRAPRSQEKRRKESYRQGTKTEEKTLKALMAIDGVGWDWSYMANKGEDHALVADRDTPTEFALMANTKSKVFDNSLCSNNCKKNTNSLNNKIKDLKNELSEANNYIYHYKLAIAQLKGRLTEYKEREVKYIEKIRTLEMYRASNLKSIKALDKELEEVKLEKDGLDGKLAGLLEASKKLNHLIESQRPSPTVASTSAEDQIKYSSTSKDVASLNLPKPFVKFVKPKGSSQNNIDDKGYWDSGCSRRRVQMETTRSQNHTYRSPSHRSGGHRPHGAHMRPPLRSIGHRPHGTSMRPSNRPVGHRPHGYWDSGCSRHMIGNISYLSDFEPFDGGYVSFGQGGCMITGKGTIKTGKLEFENVYFDPEFPTTMYKVEKAMYGIHQAPRAWYGTLSKYLLTNGFQRGTIDQTLFIRRQRGNFILVQVYVDDIIFGSSNPQLCREFEAPMHEKFQISAMVELNLFLGLQVLQKEDGIFLSQDKYVGDILKKFRYSDVRSANTPMDKENHWGKDRTRKDVDLHLYRSMIGSLMYLTASRPDIMFVVCACARNQVTPKECHLHAVKRIFRYLKGHPKLGLWYPKESPFDLVAYSDSDYGGATQDRKSTTGGCQFLGRRLILWQCKKQTIMATSTTEAEYVAAASGCGQVL